MNNLAPSSTLAIGNKVFPTKTLQLSDQLRIDMLPTLNCWWAKINYTSRPCMSMALLEDIEKGQVVLNQQLSQEHPDDPAGLKFQILSSETPQVFNLGGDLDYFLNAIRHPHDSKALLTRYAQGCVDAVYQAATGYQNRIISISLIEGEALGGGFEVALAGDYIIATEDARFGFPEMMFGMFPGMGAVSLLSQRVTQATLKEIITSTRMYSAKEMQELGVIDMVVPTGQGSQAAVSLIQKLKSKEAGFFGLKKAMHRNHPISHQAMSDIVMLWVETALQLSKSNLTVMEYILKEQHSKWGG